MLAPGDGEAEPGVIANNLKEPAKRATECSRCFCNEEARLFLARFICRPLRGLRRVWAVTPGSALPSPGASILSASFAGWLNLTSNRLGPV